MGEQVDLPFGLATSVGALPFETIPDAKTAPEAGQDVGSDAAPDQCVAAVQLTLTSQPAFPTAPTSGDAEWSLLSQAIAGLDGLETVAPGILTRSGNSGEITGCDRAGQLDAAAFQPLHAFLDQLGPHSERLGDRFVGSRIGILGPVTLSLAFRAAGMATEQAVASAAMIVAARARAILRAYRLAMPSGAVAIVMSEPGLVGAMHPTFPLSPTVLALLAPVVSALDQLPRSEPDQGLLIGVHVPGRTDWDTIISSGVSLISAPAESGLPGWSATLSAFLAAGGRVAWGVVPVNQPLGSREDLLWRRLSAVWCQLSSEGVDPLLLRSRSLISPEDGLGHFGVSQATLALGLVDSLSDRVRRQAIGARLSLGA
ncbi:MAG: hypothetical protein NTX58_08820 [Actinobacteria bacterium]|nr:hypothetical protein [Actinomycetota bacterium]